VCQLKLWKFKNAFHEAHNEPTVLWQFNCLPDKLGRLIYKQILNCKQCYHELNFSLSGLIRKLSSSLVFNCNQNWLNVPFIGPQNFQSQSKIANCCLATQ
jgi:hypothetical protein